jgi:hypothetical protein
MPPGHYDAATKLRQRLRIESLKDRDSSRSLAPRRASSPSLSFDDHSKGLQVEPMKPILKAPGTKHSKL